MRIPTVVALLAALMLAPANAHAICGDVSGDGQRTARDALAVLQAAVGIEIGLFCACDDCGTTSTTTSTLTTTTLPSACPADIPLTDLRENCTGVNYTYESPEERVTLETNGNSLSLSIEDRSGQLADASIPNATVTSATTFRYDRVCILGLGCATIPPETGRLLNNGNTLCLDLEGTTFCYQWVRGGRALQSGTGGAGDEGTARIIARTLLLVNSPR